MVEVDDVRLDGGDPQGAPCGSPAAARRRLTAARKQEAVLRVLRGEPVELVARSLDVTAAMVSAWRDAYMAAGASGLKHRPRDARDDEIDRLRAKLGETTMDKEVLLERIERMKVKGPLVSRRSKR